MSADATGFATCEKPDRYIKQLVSHWSHKMAATYADGHADIAFPSGTTAQFKVWQDGIAISLSARDEDENLRMRGVIEKHIDRFAHREAPLDYRWEGS